MEVELVLKDWRVVQNPETKLPNVAGTFRVMMGEKEIAEQAFNGGYHDKKIHFSPEVLAAATALEKSIRDELGKRV